MIALTQSQNEVHLMVRALDSAIISGSGQEVAIQLGGSETLHHHTPYAWAFLFLKPLNVH
ncbi:hypothetical protein MSC49_00280 [Methylosinus sp. C49]|nr:hypothetical protein MSC49_00280 [Methylosinus sp. C49]